MRLTELIQTTINNRLVKNLPTYRIPKRKNLLGQGNFSTVHNKNDYEIEKKSSEMLTGNECDWKYIEFLIRNPDIMAQNPHLPRYYNLKSMKKDTGRGLMMNSATSEKLISYDELEDHEKEYIKDRYFKEDLPGAAFERISSLMQFKTIIKDKLLLQAVDLIIHLAQTNPDCRVDIHQANVMYRRTPHGTIPVLNDPFYSE